MSRDYQPGREQQDEYEQQCMDAWHDQRDPEYRYSFPWTDEDKERHNRLREELKARMNELQERIHAGKNPW